MNLASFMKSRGLDDAAMAALIGDCSSHAVKKWKYGDRLPRMEQLRRIVEVSGGEVTPNDFLGLSEADSPPPRDGDAPPAGLPPSRPRRLPKSEAETGQQPLDEGNAEAMRAAE